MTIDQAADYFSTIKLSGREADIARDALQEIRSRLSFLKEVGLSYLNLDRSAPTLSGGEAQRIRLASQLGTNLQGVCYVLDEPTIVCIRATTRFCFPHLSSSPPRATLCWW